MDKIVDHLFVFEGEGRIKDFPGNYSDYRDWLSEKTKEQHIPEKKSASKPKTSNTEVRKLSYQEKKELGQLEKDIALLEEEKNLIEEFFNSGTGSSEEFVAKSKRHGEIKELLDEKEMRWLELSEIAEK